MKFILFVHLFNYITGLAKFKKNQQQQIIQQKKVFTTQASSDGTNVTFKMSIYAL